MRGGAEGRAGGFAEQSPSMQGKARSDRRPCATAEACRAKSVFASAMVSHHVRSASRMSGGCLCSAVQRRLTGAVPESDRPGHLLFVWLSAPWRILAGFRCVWIRGAPLCRKGLTTCAVVGQHCSSEGLAWLPGILCCGRARIQVHTELFSPSKLIF